MTPLQFPIGPMEMVIILIVVLLLFGGTKLAGLGKSTGRALREFKEETRGLMDKDEAGKSSQPDHVVDAEVVEPTNAQLSQSPNVSERPAPAAQHQANPATRDA